MKKLHIVAAVLTFGLLFSSCGNLVSTSDSVVEPVETTADGKARLSVTLANGTARTILPVDISESGITRAELLAKASEAASSSAVKEWASDGTASAIANMAADTEILIDAGTYDFTLNLYSDFNGTQTLCQTGTLSAVAVSSGNNALTFATKYAAGNGSLSLTLTWTAEQRVASVKAGLFTAESGGETAVTGYELADVAVLGDETSGFSATYAKTAVPSGTYFVRFELYAEDGTKINTLEDVARIATACAASKTLVLSNVNTIYKITYNLNGGAWATGYTAPASRNANKAVSLPTANDLTRTGYDFAGWYTTADFTDDTELAKIALGSTADVEVWAKWTAHEYTITYELGENATNANENPATYTIESDTITLSEPTRTGYDFTGWFNGSPEDETNKVTEITHGSTGDVTLTAGWVENTYIGTKAPDKPKAVGDVVFTDGSATPYASLTDEQEPSAIAVIFYVGTECSNNGETRTLGVGLKHTRRLAWCIYGAKAQSTNITDIQCTPVKDGDTYTFTGDKNGSDNFEQIQSFLIASNMDDDTSNSNYYPSFYFAKTYKSENGSNVKGTDYADGWYIPTIAELFQLWKSLDTVNFSGLIDCGSSGKLSTNVYWSSSQQAVAQNAYLWAFSSGKTCVYPKYTENDVYVCAIREF